MIHTQWLELLNRLLSSGANVGPRGMTTLERVDEAIMLPDMRDNIIVSEARALNYRFMVAEWLWVAFGRNDLEPLTRYNPKMAAFSDDDETLSGAYGPVFFSQWRYVVGKLREDSASRQAVITLWRPSPVPSRDIPCTISLQFLVRHHALHMIVNMRSSDAWLGVPYDVFTFTMLGNALAATVGVKPGRFILHMGSSHLYERDMPHVARIMRDSSMGTLRSPEFLTGPPVRLNFVLSYPKIEGDMFKEPWTTYAAVLRSTTSKDALSLLRSLA